MRVLQIVTLVSANGSFGGPVSVAREQCRELAKRGHEVSLVAGWDGRGHVDTAPASSTMFRSFKLIPGGGFAGLAAPKMMWVLAASLRRFDVVHVHLARDLVTLPAALMANHLGVPYVVQTHGMVQPDQRRRARMVDRLGTRRVLEDARTVLALTAEESAGLRRVAPRARLLRMGNGIGASSATLSNGSQHDPFRVLFLARLHPRKRVDRFLDMAEELLRRQRPCEFVIAGPDEGDLPTVMTRLEEGPLRGHAVYLGAVAPDAARAVLGSADIYVLPSEREPFPMTVLEALAEGTPTVVTDGCMISPELAHAGASLVCSGTPLSLADAVEKLMASPELRLQLQICGRDLVETDFSISAVTERIEEVYQRACTYRS